MRSSLFQVLTNLSQVSKLPIPSLNKPLPGTSFPHFHLPINLSQVWTSLSPISKPSHPNCHSPVQIYRLTPVLGVNRRRTRPAPHHLSGRRGSFFGSRPSLRPHPMPPTYPKSQQTYPMYGTSLFCFSTNLSYVWN